MKISKHYVHLVIYHAKLAVVEAIQIVILVLRIHTEYLIRIIALVKPDIFRMEINSVVLVTIPAILVMDQVRISVPHA